MSKPLNILVISNYYPPNTYGGYEIACFRMVEALKALGHNLAVLTSAPANHDTKSLHRLAIPVHPILSIHHYDRQDASATRRINEYNRLAVAKHLKERDYDLFYIWNLQALGIETLLPIMQYRKPVIYEYGDFWLKAYIKPYWHRVLKSISSRQPYYRITFEPGIGVSTWFTQALVDEYRLKHITTIDNAIDLSGHQDIHPPKKLNKILFCGRIVKEKGVETAIHALYHIVKEDDSIQLDIVGYVDETYSEYLQRLISELELTDHVKVLPPCLDMAKLYPHYDTLFMPTQTREPFGLVLIEAMHYGLICFASNRYGPKDIIDHEQTGVLIDTDNPKLWAECFLTYGTDKTLLKSIQSKALEQLTTKHCLAQRARVVSELFEKVIMEY